MTEQKLELLKSIYSNAKITRMIITDEKFNILWSNDCFLEKALADCNLTMFFPPDITLPIKENVIIPATIKSINYTLNVLPVMENDKTDGYLVKMVTIKELTIHQLNRDLSENQLEFFSEMRTQISGIISMSTFLHDTLERAELYDNLKYVNYQVNYCYRLLALTLNKSEVAKYAFGLFNVVRVNLKSFINDIVFITKTLLRDPSISLTFKCIEDLYIDVDTDRLVVVLLNLIINSIQYNISEQKKIILEIKKQLNNVLIIVKDNGQGMTTKQIDGIFEKFSLDFNTKPFRHKIGYGYYIINYFCKTFKSSVMINSSVNEGTTVSLKFESSKKSTEHPIYLESKTADYLSNRFSNIYIALSQVTDINFFL